MILGYDLSNFSGTPDAGALVRLRNRYDLRRAIIACQFETTYREWAEACQQAQVPYEAYLYLYNDDDYVQQLADVAAQLAAHPPLRLWLDIEDVNAPLPDASRITAAINAAKLQVYPVGVYSGAWYWEKLDNVNVSSLVPLWNANLTQHPPDPVSGFDAGYGGWVRAAVVQYAESVTLEGLNLDLDAWNSDLLP